MWLKSCLKKSHGSSSSVLQRGHVYAHMRACLCVYIFIFFAQKMTWIILSLSFQSSFSSRGDAWETFSLEDVHFKTTKANENREAEWKPLCKFNYSNCYQSFSINLLSNFSTDIMNKTSIDNLVCFLIGVVGFCTHRCVNPVSTDPPTSFCSWNLH